VDLFRHKVSENIGLHVLAELQEAARSGDNPLGERHELVMNSTLNRRWVEALMSEAMAKDSSWGEVVSELGNLQLPAFLSGEEQVDGCSLKAFLGGAVQIVQEEGELVLIPPGMWHQVYHLEPSIAVAGQLMNTANEQQVFRHMLSWCGQQQLEENKDELDRVMGLDLPVPDRIAEVIKKCLLLQHQENGELLFKELYPDIGLNL